MTAEDNIKPHLLQYMTLKAQCPPFPCAGTTFCHPDTILFIKILGFLFRFFFLVAEWWTCGGNINLRHDYFAITCSSNSIKIQKRFFLCFSLAHSLHCFDATGDSFALRTWNKEWLQSCWLSLYRETSCSSFFQLSFFFPSQEYIQAAGMT